MLLPSSPSLLMPPGMGFTWLISSCLFFFSLLEFLLPSFIRYLPSYLFFSHEFYLFSSSFIKAFFFFLFLIKRQRRPHRTQATWKAFARALNLFALGILLQGSNIFLLIQHLFLPLYLNNTSCNCIHFRWLFSRSYFLDFWCWHSKNSVAGHFTGNFIYIPLHNLL